VNVRSFGKVNLGLEVVRRRPDGYHDIRTLFQTVDLSDELTFEPAADGALRLEGDDPSIAWDATNLIHRAARILREKTGCALGASIGVRKRVPPGKGLGGGSANAAVTLLALNALWGLGLSLDELAGPALSTGSDVPYFLRGGLCLGEGRGEALTALPDLPPVSCLLVFPPYEISTAEVYAGFGPFLTSGAKDSKIMRFLDTGDFGLLENDLEKVVLQRNPELDALKRFLKDGGASLAMVSGSGSAVFGLFPEKDKALAARERLGGKSTAVLTETLPRDGYRTRVGAGA
jgi:4-diphosphocytidyl-2-C-methyl-D-erythritol kinase